jgi:hypothetical protein
VFKKLDFPVFADLVLRLGPIDLTEPTDEDDDVETAGYQMGGGIR